jgi:putative ABC transport system ATP-binding protein
VTPSADPVVVCRAVRRTYQLAGSSVAALRGVDLDLPAGTFTALVGPSGSGKSTLLRLLACVDRPDEGQLTVAGRRVERLSRSGRVRLRRRRLGFVFQAPADNLLDYLTVAQHLRLAAQLRGQPSASKLRRLPSAAMLPPADAGLHELLDRLGLADRADHLPRQLSGGEQQRAAIAFAAVGPPALLVADEPTGQLDHSLVDGVLDALRALAGAGVAVVAATHDPAVAERADRVVRMRDGRIEEAT